MDPRNSELLAFRAHLRRTIVSPERDNFTGSQAARVQLRAHRETPKIYSCLDGATRKEKRESWAMGTYATGEKCRKASKKAFVQRGFHRPSNEPEVSRPRSRDARYALVPSPHVAGKSTDFRAKSVPSRKEKEPGDVGAINFNWKQHAGALHCAELAFFLLGRVLNGRGGFLPGSGDR